METKKLKNIVRLAEKGYICDKVKVKRVIMGNIEKRRTREEIESDMWIESQMYSRGLTYAEIAKEMNGKGHAYHTSPEMVKRDVEQVLVEWKRDNLEALKKKVVEEVFKLEALEREALEGYRASKGLTSSDYATLIKRGYTVEEIDEVFGSKLISGDPRFLQVKLNIQTQKMKLLGLDKGNDVPQKTIINYNLGGLDDATLTSIADKLQDQKLNEIVSEKTTDEQ